MYGEKSDDDDGFIYFVEMDEADYMKVGFTTDPYGRVASLQTGNPYKLRCYATFPAKRRDEKAVHALLKEFKHEREWFYPGDEIDKLVEDISWYQDHRAAEIMIVRGLQSPEDFHEISSEVTVGEYLADPCTWDFDFRQGRQ